MKFKIKMQYMRHFYLVIEQEALDDTEFLLEAQKLGFVFRNDILDKFMNVVKSILDQSRINCSPNEFLIKVKLSLINSVGKIFPNRFSNDTQHKLEKENLVLAFSRIVNLSAYSHDYNDKFFKQAMLEHLLVVAKLSLWEEQLSIIVLNTIVNSLGAPQCIKEFDRIMGLVISAFIKYPNSTEISILLKAILGRYCIGKQKLLNDKFKDVQFIFLKDVYKFDVQLFDSSIYKVRKTLYTDEQAIEECLLHLASNIEKKNTEDLLLLNLRYIIEIIEDKDSEVHKILQKPHIKDIVCSKIFSIRNRSFIQSSAASIGTCENTVPNASQFISEENCTHKLLYYYGQFVSVLGIQNIWMTEDMKPPTENLPPAKTHEESKSECDQDSDEEIDEWTWNKDICVIDKDYIKIHRDNYVVFGYNLYQKMQNLIISTDRPPNTYFYSIWKLESILQDKSKLMREIPIFMPYLFLLREWY